MFKKFYPREYYSSTFVIDFEKYYEEGYRGLLFDIDNTIVGHDAPYDENAVHFFDRLKKTGFKSCLVSNNSDARVRPFAEGVGCEYVCNAKKPDPSGYIKAMELLGCDTANTLFIGDQLFTDIWGANNAGVYSILVRPLGGEILTRIKIKRKGEKVVLFFYKHSKYSNIHK